jgi:hypothetical protein
MSEFDSLKDDAEKLAQQHPDQVREGEQAAEKKFGLGGQDQSGQGDQQDQSGQGSGQDQSGQGQQDQQN